jgi:hypothetical protein
MMKQSQVLILSLTLLPALAQGEAGAQLTAWAASSPRPAHEGDAQPQPGPQPEMKPAPATPDVVATEPKKDEKQTIVATTTPDQLATLSGLSVNASFDSYLGQGTFYNAAEYAFLASSLFLSARYQFSLFHTKFAATGTGYVLYEYTMPDAPTGRRFTWRDLGFSLSAPAIYKETRFTGISLTPSVAATVPITPESWTATTITILSAGLNFTRSIGKFDLAMSVSGSKGFHRSWVSQVGSPNPAPFAPNTVIPDQHPDTTQRPDVLNPPTVICRASDPLLCGGQQTNNAFGFGYSLTADFRATENLSFSAQYVFRMGWRYPIVAGPDMYTPQALTSSGQPVADTGYVRAPDLVITSLAVNYQISDHWGVSLYTYTAMPPKTADDKNFRFPFWDFISGPMNYSQLGLSLSASF